MAIFSKNIMMMMKSSQICHNRVVTSSHTKYKIF